MNLKSKRQLKMQNMINGKKGKLIFLLRVAPFYAKIGTTAVKNCYNSF